MIDRCEWCGGVLYFEDLWDDEEPCICGDFEDDYEESENYDRDRDACSKDQGSGEFDESWS